MKKIVLLIFILTYLFSYITATSITNGKNILYFTNNGRIIIKDGNIENIQIKNFNIKLIHDFKTKDIASQEDKEFGEHHFIKVVDYKDIFSFLILNNDDEVIIRKNNNEDVEYIKKYTDDILSPIFGNVKATCKSINEVTYCSYNNIPIYIKIGDDTYMLKQIKNNNVLTYLDKKKSLKLHLDNFDFSKEPIFAKFLVNTTNEIDYINIYFKTVNLQNGMFLVRLEGSGSFFYNDDSKIRIESYLIDLDNQLFQVGGQLFVDNEKISLWKQYPNLIKVPLTYLDDKGNQRNIIIIRDKKPLYDFGGLLYFVSWCNIHKKNSAVFRYVDRGAINGKIKKIGNNKYNVKVYIGDINKLNLNIKLDNYSRVVSIEDLVNNKKMELVGEYTNDTIEKNKKFLKNLFNKLHLKEIDG